MTTICRLIGGAGTGKTSYLMDVIMQWLEKHSVNPFQIGYVSFTRAARAEAAGRAAEIAGVGKDELESAGYFRTIHSICYKQLGIGKELLTDTKESRQWIATALGIAPAAAEVLEGEEEPTSVRETASDEMNALALWDMARARLEPLQAVWERAAEINEFVPDWPLVENTVNKYEQYKRLDGRCDFTDILGRFAGVQFQPRGHAEVTPKGDSPGLRIWFLDEWQDASALLDRCARRMTDGADAVYLAGDPFQSIFQFAGSDHRHFLGWSADKEKTMQQSWRCPRSILSLGEEILSECTDYWDRKINPRDEEGEIETAMLDGGWINELDPRVKTLVIARSNAHVRRLIGKLDTAGLPWVPTRGSLGKWAAPTRRSALLGLINLQNGDAIYAHEWTAVLKLLPSKHSSGELIQHGGKTTWKDQERGSDERIDLEHLGDWFATPVLVDLIRAGHWKNLIENGHDFYEAWKTWGEDAVVEPQIQAGTIHSVKGAEGQHVVLLTTTSRQCSKAMQHDEAADEERRVAYVGVTRARKKLTVLKEKTLNQMRIPV